MPEACGLASEWRMVTWGARMRGYSGHNNSMEIKKECGNIMNATVACTLKHGDESIFAR